ncbi:hypothetical protein IKF63_02830 [Candidatus Saccharibacteria bacterium]|nr:hypothetical protein [Candidatus Saccharibacteria bacterium]
MTNPTDVNDVPSNKKPKIPKSKLSSGSRNLLILGLGSTIITFLFTFITLKIYHDSGDIYLDRSRPGFLPEKEEAERDKDNTDYSFPDSGVLTSKDMDEYLENLAEELDRLNDFSSDPFGPKPLSDESLGI